MAIAREARTAAVEALKARAATHHAAAAAAKAAAIAAQKSKDGQTDVQGPLVPRTVMGVILDESLCHVPDAVVKQALRVHHVHSALMTDHLAFLRRLYKHLTAMAMAQVHDPGQLGSVTGADSASQIGIGDNSIPAGSPSYGILAQGRPIPSHTQDVLEAVLAEITETIAWLRIPAEVQVLSIVKSVAGVDDVDNTGAGSSAGAADTSASAASSTTPDAAPAPGPGTPARPAASSSSSAVGGSIASPQPLTSPTKPAAASSSAAGSNSNGNGNGGAGSAPCDVFLVPASIDLEIEAEFNILLERAHELRRKAQPPSEKEMTNSFPLVRQSSQALAALEMVKVNNEKSAMLDLLTQEERDRASAICHSNENELPESIPPTYTHQPSLVTPLIPSAPDGFVVSGHEVVLRECGQLAGNFSINPTTGAIVHATANSSGGVNSIVMTQTLAGSLYREAQSKGIVDPYMYQFDSGGDSGIITKAEIGGLVITNQSQSQLAAPASAGASSAAGPSDAAASASSSAATSPPSTIALPAGIDTWSYDIYPRQRLDKYLDPRRTDDDVDGAYETAPLPGQATALSVSHITHSGFSVANATTSQLGGGHPISKGALQAGAGASAAAANATIRSAGLSAAGSVPAPSTSAAGAGGGGSSKGGSSVSAGGGGGGGSGKEKKSGWSFARLPRQVKLGVRSTWDMSLATAMEMVITADDALRVFHRMQNPTLAATIQQLRNAPALSAIMRSGLNGGLGSPSRLLQLQNPAGSNGPMPLASPVGYSGQHSSSAAVSFASGLTAAASSAANRVVLVPSLVPYRDPKTGVQTMVVETDAATGKVKVVAMYANQASAGGAGGAGASSASSSNQLSSFPPLPPIAAAAAATAAASELAAGAPGATEASGGAGAGAPAGPSIAIPSSSSAAASSVPNPLTSPASITALGLDLGIPALSALDADTDGLMSRGSAGIDEGFTQLADPVPGDDDDDVDDDDGLDGGADAQKKKGPLLSYASLRRSLLRWHIANLEYGCAAGIGRVSLCSWDQDDMFNHHDHGRHAFIRDGYDTHVRGMAINVPVIYGAEVKEVAWDIGRSGADASSGVSSAMDVDGAAASSSSSSAAQQQGLGARLTLVPAAPARPPPGTTVSPYTPPPQPPSLTAWHSSAAVGASAASSAASSASASAAAPPSASATLDVDAVVVTVPIGVLQDGRPGFNPPLPEWKQQAISAVGSGLLNKVILRFPRPFWRSGVPDQKEVAAALQREGEDEKAIDSIEREEAEASAAAAGGPMPSITTGAAAASSSSSASSRSAAGLASPSRRRQLIVAAGPATAATASIAANGAPATALVSAGLSRPPARPISCVPFLDRLTSRFHLQAHWLADPHLMTAVALALQSGLLGHALRTTDPALLSLASGSAANPVSASLFACLQAVGEARGDPMAAARLMYRWYGPQAADSPGASSGAGAASSSAQPLLLTNGAGAAASSVIGASSSAAAADDAADWEDKALSSSDFAHTTFKFPPIPARGTLVWNGSEGTSTDGPGPADAAGASSSAIAPGSHKAPASSSASAASNGIGPADDAFCRVVLGDSPASVARRGEAYMFWCMDRVGKGARVYPIGTATPSGDKGELDVSSLPEWARASARAAAAEAVPTDSSHVLICMMAGEAAEWVEKAADVEVLDRVMQALRSLFDEPSATTSSVPEPTAHFITRWRSDRYARGSYSHLLPSSHGVHYDLMAAPVGQTVFFAGEATNRHHPTTAAGAFDSGVREAVRISRMWGRAREPDVMATLAAREMRVRAMIAAGVQQPPPSKAAKGWA